MADLTELFARLKNPNSASPSPVPSVAQRSSAATGSQNYQHPSVSSPIVSPPPAAGNTPPRHPEHVLSASASPLPNSRPQNGAAKPEQTASLLSLLQARTPAASSDTGRSLTRNENTTTPVSASDLVASFARHTPTPSRVAESHASPSTTPLHAPRASTTVAANPQDMLLTLLKRPESTPHGHGSSSGNAENASSASVRGTSRVAGNDPALHHSPIPIPGTEAKTSLFSHRDPFDSLPAVQPDAAPSNNATAAHSSRDAQRQAVEQTEAAARHVAQRATQHIDQAVSVAGSAPAETGELGNDLKNAVHEVAVELSEELQDGKTKHELEDQFSKPVAAALQASAAAAANDDVADTWESAESDEAAKGESSRYKVKVYNLPMRPFVSLEVNASQPTPSIVRPDVVMKIASLRKEFDQVDRTLATASPKTIVYAMTKGGGYRIIRQDDGSNKTVFRHAENQIFNISITSSPKSEEEAILATGVNGHVFWTCVPSDLDLSADDLTHRSFVFPPPPSPDENTSTAQLKTRVQKSCRHPSFFAYGRSKTIYLVWPSVAQHDQYMNKKTRIVDSVKYLNDRCVRIATGKAGKDFAFSEDDSTIVSLDKHGKLKFWDISDHINPDLEHQHSRHVSTEIKEPVMTLWVSSSSTRAWPTSVCFVDKDRPTAKGLALRYMLVGLKQNHTIQLWDLGLGKAVQELNLPHHNETDAICSIAYHPKSGIIVVGHPTRNSLYLIHLSAPKYNLPPLSQAKFIRALESKDKGLPRPESTAIMSGLREVSLSSIGDLRSVDVISSSQPVEEQGPDGETVFEVYTMHSKGVTCLNMKRRDLGWGNDGKVAEPEDGEREKIVTVSELQSRALTESGEHEELASRGAEGQSKVMARPAKAESKKESEATSSKNTAPSTPVKPPVNGADKTEKKKKKRNEDGEAGSTAVKEPSVANAAGTSVDIAHQGPNLAAPVDSLQAREVPERSLAPPPSTRESTSTATTGTGNHPPANFADVLHEHMKSLYRRIDDDRRVLDATSNARQDAVLRLVSSTLTENVEQSLSQIIAKSMKESVLPALTNVALSTLDQKIPQAMSQQLGDAIPREVRASLPDAVSKAFQSQSIQQALAATISNKINAVIERHLATAIQSQLTSTLASVAAEAGASVTREASRQFDEQLRIAQQQSQRDAAKIDQLSSAMVEMTSTLTSMAQVQAELQREVLLLRGELSRPAERGSEAVADPIANPEDAEAESIAADIRQGRLEQGTIKWLQSNDQEGLFGRVFSKLDPTYLHGVNQIVVLSVAASVSQTLADAHLTERLSWLEVSLGAVDAQSVEIASFAPRMMDILIERLSDEYMRLAECATESRVLTRIHTLVRRAKEIKAAVVAE